jgi:hypothetical protein
VAWTYLAVLGQIDLEGFGVVLEPQGRHGEKDVFSIDGFALLLVTLFGSYTMGINMAARR